MEPVWLLFPFLVRRHSAQDASTHLTSTGFCIDSTSFEILRTTLKRPSNARVGVFAMDSTSFEVLRTNLKQTSNDPQTLAYWFLQWILQVLRFSERASNEPQTNMAAQYPESSRLRFPGSLFGGCFHHLFVAILPRMRPHISQALVFA